MKKIRVRYFATLREQAGMSEEHLFGDFKTPEDVYDWIRESRHVTVERGLLRVAVNDVFSEFDTELHDGDEVVFIPPVSGG